MSSEPRTRSSGQGPPPPGPGSPAPGRRIQLGREGERLACARLTEAGLRVIARNWRCRLGEIDVIATGPGLLVFCEVKTRRGDAYGTAAAAVTPAKQARLRRLAAEYLASVDHRPCRVRFDVVTVRWPRGATFYTRASAGTPVRWRSACPPRPRRPRPRLRAPSSQSRLEI